MKSFAKFLTETSASQQAQRLGLEGDGHGGWYDRSTGEFIAKTVKGTLKFYNKRQVVGMKDPAQSEQEKNYSNPNTQVPPEGQQQAQSAPAAPEPKATARIEKIAFKKFTFKGAIKKPTTQVKITNDITRGFIRLNKAFR